MRKYVADTVALVLHLENRKMPPKTKNLFQEADKGNAEIIVPSMALVEVGYLAEKSRIQLTLLQVENHFMSHPAYRVQPLTLEVINEAFQINDIPELHDRLIAGTAKWLDVEIITNDPKIMASKSVKSVWK